jgi:hypothetical protein
MSAIRALLEEHGGIVALVTHPVHRPRMDRRSGAMIATEWQNTIVCRDGWTRALTCRDESEIRGSLPERLKAVTHLMVNEDGEVSRV